MRKINQVYVVDDDKIYQFIIKKELESSGKVNKISFFTDGDQAAKALEQSVNSRTDIPDLILLDINMPVMDGWEFLKEYQKIRKGIENPCHIFLVSSSVDERDMERSKEHEEIAGYIVKPLKKEKLDIVFSKFNFE